MTDYQEPFLRRTVNVDPYTTIPLASSDRHSAPSQHPGFTVFGHSLSYKLAIALFSLMTVLGTSGQSIGLDLFLASFQGATGAYFVLFFCSSCFVVFFGSMAFHLYRRGELSPLMLSLQWHPYMMAVGVFDALNGFLTVFASNPARVPPPMQSILANSIIPFTLVLSTLIVKRRYTIGQSVSAGVIMAGVIYSLIPMFRRLSQGGDSTQLQNGWGWPFIYILGCVPAALMNIVQEKMQHAYRERVSANAIQSNQYPPIPEKANFSVLYFQFVESFYQWSFIALCFWADLIPGFGTSTNAESLWESFRNGYMCFVNQLPSSPDVDNTRCAGYATGFGLLFVFSYMNSYIFSTLLTDHASANWLSLLSGISPCIATTFWFTFPSINQWAGAGDFDNWDIAFSLTSLPMIGIALWFYSRETEKSISEQERNQRIQPTKPIELIYS